VNIVETSEQGFDALAIDNGVVATTIVPDLGAKLTSLRDLRHDREWLWRSDRLADRRHAYDASYVGEADTGGWDECFPTVAPCRHPTGPSAGIDLPDHGELWSQPWATEIATIDGAARVRSSAHGVQLSYQLTRSIVLAPDAASIELEYELVSTGGHDLDFIWSAHPLFPLEPGGAVRLPENTVLHTWSADGDAAVLDLTSLPACDAGFATKLWSDPLDAGWAELVSPSGRALRMAWDVAEIPQVGVWVNAGGWSGIGGAPYCNLALEPCIGAQDSLEDAVLRHGSFATLPAGASMAWRLRVELT